MNMNMLRVISRNNKGVAVVEVILILVILITLVIIFKSEITELVTKIWKAINEGAGKII